MSFPVSVQAKRKGKPMYASSAEAKANGWHSRRNETREAQDYSRTVHQQKAKPKARIERRLKRIAKTAAKSLSND